jgi:hypothetical protein
MKNYYGSLTKPQYIFIITFDRPNCLIVKRFTILQGGNGAENEENEETVSSYIGSISFGSINAKGFPTLNK